MSIMRRQLVLLLDGTWNKREDSTNVWRTKLMLQRIDTQLCYYDEGVGTVRGEEFSGGALGSGITRKVLSAYLWLVENYLDASASPTGESDDLFIFGFSRGAYTARSLVGVLSIVGIVRRNAIASVREAFELSRTPLLKESAPSAIEFRKRYSHSPTVQFLGVWDTVEALGVPRVRNPFCPSSEAVVRRPEHKVQDLPSIVRHARHALALDEFRWIFDAILWRNRGSSHTIEQRWFVGAHANVGGGYLRDALYTRPLQWMISEACAAGMLLMPSQMYLPDAFYLSTPRNSLDEALLGLYNASQWLQPHYRMALQGRGVGQIIDYTVLQRWLWDIRYRPPALHCYLPLRPKSRPTSPRCKRAELIELLNLDPERLTSTGGLKVGEAIGGSTQ